MTMKPKNYQPMALLNEPENVSVASLCSSEDEAAWVEDDEYPNWWYLSNRNECFSSLLQRKCSSPIFHASLDSTSSLVFQCATGWGSKATKVYLKSPALPSTLKAFEALMDLVHAIPLEVTSDWMERQEVELGFLGMSPPLFANTIPVGLPGMICTLSWGKKDRRHSVLSDPKLNRDLAFADAVKKARVKAAAMKSIMEPQPLQNEPNWNSKARQLINANKKSVPQHTKVTFEPIASSRKIICKISWGAKFDDSVRSVPSIGKEEALADAIRLICNKLNPIPACTTVKTSSPAMPALDAHEFMGKFRQRLQVEHAWLMKMKNPTQRDSERVLRLSGFFVLMDPLRCYEIEPRLRRQVMHEFQRELEEFSSRKAPKRIQAAKAECLRSLLQRQFAEPGTPISPNAKFEMMMYSKGVEPSQAIRELVDDLLVRQSPDKQLSLSTVGANLLEQFIQSNAAIGSVASALPLEVAAMMLDLREKLNNTA